MAEIALEPGAEQYLLPADVRAPHRPQRMNVSPGEIAIVCLVSAGVPSLRTVRQLHADVVVLEAAEPHGENAWVALHALGHVLDGKLLVIHPQPYLRDLAFP